jgi:hypothetical protein
MDFTGVLNRPYGYAKEVTGLPVIAASSSLLPLTSASTASWLSAVRSACVRECAPKEIPLAAQFVMSSFAIKGSEASGLRGLHGRLLPMIEVGTKTVAVNWLCSRIGNANSVSVGIVERYHHVSPARYVSATNVSNPLVGRYGFESQCAERFDLLRECGFTHVQ